MFPSRRDSPLTVQCPLLAPRTSWHQSDSLPTYRRRDSLLTVQCPLLAPRTSWHQSDSLPTYRRRDSPLTVQCPLLARRTSWLRSDSLPTSHHRDSFPTAQRPFLAPRTSWHLLDSLPTSHRPDSSPTAQCLFLARRASWHLLDSCLQGSSLRYLAARWSTFLALLQRPCRRTHLAWRLLRLSACHGFRRQAEPCFRSPCVRAGAVKVLQLRAAHAWLLALPASAALSFRPTRH